MNDDEQLRQQLLIYQRNEITEYHVYRKLAKTLGAENQRILLQMAEQELRHYHVWQKHTKRDVKPNWRAVWLYYLVSRVFGFTFGAKLLERREQSGQINYEQIQTVIPEAERIREEEHNHETALLRMLDERKLHYTGSMVLGLSDALVELTGAAAGLTLALQDTQLVAVTISLTGISAAMSMGASEYLSSKAEATDKNPVTAAIYTGAVYIATVLILVLPYLVLENPYVALAVTLTSAISIIAFFNFYISVAKGVPFKRRFFEMAGLSLGIAAISFVLGFLLRTFLDIDV